MTIDTKKLRELLVSGAYDIGEDRASLPRTTVIALLDEIERLRGAVRGAEVLLRDHMALTHRCIELTVARDELANIAEGALHPGNGKIRPRIAALRLIGTEGK